MFAIYYFLSISTKLNCDPKNGTTSRTESDAAELGGRTATLDSDQKLMSWNWYRLQGIRANSVQLAQC